METIPGDPLENVIQQAHSLLEAGNAESAIKVLESASQNHTDGPSLASLQFHLGVAYFMGKGELDSALDHFNKSLHHEPNRSDALFNRAAVLLQRGDTEAAIKDLDSYLQLNPSDHEAIQNRGFAQLQLGNHQIALKDFDRALELQPDHYGALNNRANILINAFNDPTKALLDLDRAIRVDPLSYIAYKNRGYAKSLKGDFEGAITDFYHCLALNPPMQEEREQIQEMLNEAVENKDHKPGKRVRKE